MIELEPRRLLSAYVVNDSSDLPLDPAIGPGETADGTITLRSAIQQVDIDGTGSIRFASSMTITTSGLPTITASGVTIDEGSLGSVVVQGNGAAASGLILAGTDAAITGLEITGFGHDGIDVGATGATIGGTTAGTGIAIFGNAGAGLSLGSFGGSARVQGDFIGTDPAGTAGLGNKGDGIYIGSAGNTIGGSSAAARNVISGNTVSAGVEINGAGATGNVVAGDFIGTNIAGTAALANYAGVVIGGGATDNLIGASGGNGGPNVISGNTTNGVFITGAGTSGNLVAGNNIGTNAAGTASIANNRSGILLDNRSTDTTVGLPGAGNLISGNGGRGIAAFGVNGTIIQANLIGTNAAGTAVIPGDYVNGIEIDNGSATIGGTTPGTTNVISIGPGGTDGPDSGPYYAGGYDEQPSGITLNWIAEPATVTAALIEGNRIGTDITGTVALGNPAGITISSAAGATIGGTAAGAGNLIADSQQDGVVLDYIGASDNLIQGNTIVDNGLQTSTGSWAGIRIFNEPSATNSASTGNTIGGTTARAGNIIADNAGPGVAIDGPYATGNVVEGNVIGTNAGGSLAEGNGMGVDIEGAPLNLVQGNVIAASAGPGVLINNTATTINGFTAAPGAVDNLVAGNSIGTTADGTQALGNTGNGVQIEGGATGNTIGGTVAGAANLIAYNGGSGVGVGLGTTDASLGNAIRENAIFSNSGSGIIVNNSAPQAAPSLGIATSTSSQTTITGTVTGAPSTNLVVEFFSNPAGTGQGETYIGTLEVTTTASGVGPFTFSTSTLAAAGLDITATATDPNGNTSEFSAPLAVTPLTIASIAAVSPNPRNTAVTTIDVTFSEPVNTATFSAAALTLTDNGAVVPLSGTSLALVSGTTYAINGLAAFTGAEGSYVLTVNMAGIQDQNGFGGEGALSTSWLMDTTPPASTISPLLRIGNSLSFSVTITGSDPNGAGDSTPSGIAAFTIYVATNGGAWRKWTTLAPGSTSGGPASATATFTGLSNTTYAFYATATDAAGNVQAYHPTIEASTYLPDLTPPVTSVDPATGAGPSSVNPSTGTFTLELTGTAPGGKPLTYFELFVGIDLGGGGNSQQVGAAIPAGSPDAPGVYHATITYQGLTDGKSHSYTFSSLGIDGAGLVQATPVNPVTFTNQSFTASSLEVTGLTVEHGAAERSYIRYLDVNFNESDLQSGSQLTAIAGSLGTSSPAVQLYKYDLNGDAASKAAVPLSGVSATVIDHAIELDFGAAGVGGIANTTAGDGYYELDVSVGSITYTHFFDRLLGDVTGDGVADRNDLNAIAAELTLSSPTGYTPLSADVNGNGTVSALDTTLATRAKGHRLGAGFTLG